ncbi:MAG: hypothetical protein BAJALOKI3v1_460027 [Promethearchaeota archaeon]|jgi:hypothetical protein|nr:MAG: hypothetical protein BAJALOKI3v1_460027 [Candidatus Lokiarchaeota archaeon]
MATTIQISDATKKKLFGLINQLEHIWNKRVTYDDAIQYLLKNRKLVVEKKDFIDNISKYKGILKKGEARELYEDLRKKERKREERLEKQFDSN